MSGKGDKKTGCRQEECVFFWRTCAAFGCFSTKSMKILIIFWLFVFHNAEKTPLESTAYKALVSSPSTDWIPSNIQAFLKFHLILAAKKKHSLGIPQRNAGYKRTMVQLQLRWVETRSSLTSSTLIPQIEVQKKKIEPRNLIKDLHSS